MKLSGGYIVTVNVRVWELFKDLQNARKVRKQLRGNDLFRQADISIYGPRGGKIK